MSPTRREALAGAGTAALSSLMPRPASAADNPGAEEAHSLWYRQPATAWVEALPVGNGRLGGMVFGGITAERIQLNEDSFFAGGPYDADNPESAAAMPEVRRLIFAGDYAAAEKLANQKLLGRPVKQMAYQPIGSLMLTFPALEEPRDYRRSLDLDGAIATTRFRTGSIEHLREVIASAPDGVIAVRLSAGARGTVTVTAALTSPHPHLVPSECVRVYRRTTAPGTQRDAVSPVVQVRGWEEPSGGPLGRAPTVNSLRGFVKGRVRQD